MSNHARTRLRPKGLLKKGILIFSLLYFYFTVKSNARDEIGLNNPDTPLNGWPSGWKW